MVQLDLFGNPIEPQKPVKSVAKAANTLPAKPAEEAILVNNGNAGFKVKLKPTQPTSTEPLTEDVVAEIPTPPVEQVEAKPVEITAEETPEEANEVAEVPAVVEAMEATPPEEAEPIPPAEAVDLPTETPVDEMPPDYLPYPATVSLEPAAKRGRLSFKEMEESAKLVSVPAKEELYQKQYYSISTVASWFNVNISLLRFWENEFDIIQPRKTRKGDRLFRPQDVENLQIIHYLLRVRKFSIQGAKQYLSDNKKEIDTTVFLQQTLQNFKTFLTELKANLEA